MRVYPDKTASTMKRGEFVMYPVPAVLPSFSLELRQIIIYNGHALVGCLPAGYKEDYSTIQEQASGSVVKKELQA